MTALTKTEQEKLDRKIAKARKGFDKNVKRLIDIATWTVRHCESVPDNPGECWDQYTMVWDNMPKRLTNIVTDDEFDYLSDIVYNYVALLRETEKRQTMTVADVFNGLVECTFGPIP